MTGTKTPEQAAATYFDAWRVKDFDALRAVLSDDVTFRGPLGQANGVDECLQGLRGLAEQMTNLQVLKRLSDDTDVMTWFDLTLGDATLPTVNWQHVEDGKIARIRVTFDPRPVIGS